MSDVAELLLKPRELLSILPLQVEIRSLQGSNIIACINAFGFKGEAALGVTVSRTPEKIMVRYDVIGEILFGRYIPPRSELSLTITASKSGDSATEIVFEVFVRSGFLKELNLSKEVNTLLPRVPDVFTSAMRRPIEGREGIVLEGFSSYVGSCCFMVIASSPFPRILLGPHRAWGVPGEANHRERRHTWDIGRARWSNPEGG